MGMFEGEGDKTVSYEGLEMHVVSTTTKKEVLCWYYHDYGRAFEVELHTLPGLQ